MTASVPVFAAEHESADKAPEPMQFVVNIGKTPETMRYLAIKLVPDYANPEVSKRFEQIKPRMSHRIILSVSDQDPAALMTNQGKLDLRDMLVTELNNLLHVTRETGVKDVFFTEFVIQ